MLNEFCLCFIKLIKVFYCNKKKLKIYVVTLIAALIKTLVLGLLGLVSLTTLLFLK